MNVSVEESDETIDESYIPRLVEEISFVDHIEGDYPNVQIEGYRSAYSTAVPVMDGMRVRFRTMSMPTAYLIWHCPFFLLFSSDDAVPLGKNYIEHGCVRLDGENATNNDLAVNEFSVQRTESFTNWDGWKKDNKKGFECEVVVRRRRNRITLETTNAGISVKSTTTIPQGHEDVYFALTGDQCALTDIRVLE